MCLCTSLILQSDLFPHTEQIWTDWIHFEFRRAKSLLSTVVCTNFSGTGNRSVRVVGPCDRFSLRPFADAEWWTGMAAWWTCYDLPGSLSRPCQGEWRRHISFLKCLALAHTVQARFDANVIIEIDMSSIFSGNLMLFDSSVNVDWYSHLFDFLMFSAVTASQPFCRWWMI